MTDNNNEYWYPKKLKIHKKDKTTISIGIPKEYYPFKSKVANKDSTHEEDLIKWIKLKEDLTVEYAGVNDANIHFTEL